MSTLGGEKPMRMADLSRTTEVPVPTVKYYLREGLLPSGSPTGRNQADYGEEHVRRLRLIRVLREVGGLGIAQVRRVLDAIDAEELSLHQVLGRAHHALGPTGESFDSSPELDKARAQVDRFIEELGWRVSPDAPSRGKLAEALLALQRLCGVEGPETFAPYAAVADRIAAAELASGPENASRVETVEWMVIGTVVYEAALAALRRLAQEHHSAREFA
jgi:DNA-binding transcriptional MerR regulator